MNAQRYHDMYVNVEKGEKMEKLILRKCAQLETEGADKVGETKVANDVGDIANETENGGQQSTNKTTQSTKAEYGGDELSNEFAIADEKMSSQDQA
jgi:hypothetical protein